MEMIRLRPRQTIVLSASLNPAEWGAAGATAARFVFAFQNTQPEGFVRSKGHLDANDRKRIPAGRRRRLASGRSKAPRWKSTTARRPPVRPIRRSPPPGRRPARPRRRRSPSRSTPRRRTRSTRSIGRPGRPPRPADLITRGARLACSEHMPVDSNRTDGTSLPEQSRRDADDMHKGKLEESTGGQCASGQTSSASPSVHTCRLTPVDT